MKKSDNNKLVQLWFHHDYGARNDPKLLRVNRVVGDGGIGIYWCLVELLYEQGGIVSMEEVDALTYFMRFDELKVKEVIKICFDFNNDNGTITSERITKEIQKTNERSAKMSKASNARWSKTRVVPLPDWMDEDGNVKENKPTKMTEEEKERCQKAMKDLFGDDDK